MVDTTADKVKFDKEADVKPLTESLKKVFQPLFKVMPQIALIPKEIKRLTDNIKKDMDSGVPDRFLEGVNKIIDSQNVVIDKLDKKAVNAASRKEEGDATAQRLTQSGKPAVADERGKVRLLTKTEIRKEQDRLVQLETIKETKISENKDLTAKAQEGDTEALAKIIRNEKAIEQLGQGIQGKEEKLGSKARRIQGPEPEKVTGRDFVPQPLLEVYDNIEESVKNTGEVFGSFGKPFTAFFKLAKQKFGKEEEHRETQEEWQKDDKEDKKIGIADRIKSFLMIGGILAAVIGVGLAVWKIYDSLPSWLGGRKEKELTDDQKYSKSKQGKLKEQYIKEGMSNEDAGVKAREGTSDFDFVPRMFGFGDALDKREKILRGKDREKDLGTQRKWKGNIQAFDMNTRREELASATEETSDSSSPNIIIANKKDGDSNISVNKKVVKSDRGPAIA